MAHPIHTIYSIDPSIKMLGFAVFKQTVEGRWTLASSRVVKSPGECLGNWVDRLDWMTAKASELIGLPSVHGLSTVVIELPDHHTAAAKNTMSIEKLTALVFSIRAAALQKSFVVKLAPVRTWKGNCPKEITQRRARKHWGWTGSDHNEADAVGIGGWLINQLQSREATVKRPTNRPLTTPRRPTYAVAHEDSKQAAKRRAKRQGTC